ncbi:MAG: flagellar basal body rod protein FlgB [Pseudomonadota bacterium]
MFGDMSVFSVLREKMAWHQSRQTVLAENIANADTPDYAARDLRPQKFDDAMAAAREGANLQTVRTNAGHMGGGFSAGATFARDQSKNGWEITPEGNGVVLEEQMMKVAENQMEFEVATTIYSRAMGLLRQAVSNR